jgi:hypothetical protein
MLYRKFHNMITSNTESDIFISYEDLIDSEWLNELSVIVWLYIYIFITIYINNSLFFILKISIYYKLQKMVVHSFKKKVK